MTIHLPEDLEASIRAEVDRGRFASADDAVAEAVRTFLRREPEEGAEPAATERTAPPPGHKPIWEQILEITADVPEEAWDALPTDLSAQHDHYIYGTPKRPIS